jgi:hypothetical protein
MGSATPSIPDSVSVITSQDVNTVGATAFASGPIGDVVTLISFSVSLSDRVAGKNGSSATVVFAPSVGGDVSIGYNITLNYPANFFLQQPAPSASLSDGSSAIVTSHSDSAVVLTVTSGKIIASTAVTVILSGFTMGPVAADTPNSISVITTNDANTENLMRSSSGHIGHRVLLSSFVIANDDRLDSKTDVAATLMFTPSVGGAIAAGGSLTLYYPPTLFAMRDLPELPKFNCSAVGVQGAVRLADGGQSWIAVTTSGSGAIAASQPVVVTLSGLKMGSAIKSHATGVSVSTSQDQVASLPLDAGAIGSRLTLQLFIIKFTDAVAGKLDSSVTITFRPSVGGAIPPGGRITVKYFAKGFFHTSYIPQFSCSVPHVTGVCAFDVSNPKYSAIVITTGGSSAIPGDADVTITLSGLTMGAVSDGGSVVVDTSTDHDSETVFSGPIYSRNYVRLVCALPPFTSPQFACRWIRFWIRWLATMASGRTACSTSGVGRIAPKIRGVTQVCDIAPLHVAARRLHMLRFLTLCRLGS